ncbi:hypothetical protein [Bacillus thuringiensis]|uniref:Uncharacterized protein n=1 Tax=Bacillus thuringiensis TaxID=1428 RepID=A0A9X6WGW0_BACTU|nr:hypothetical protein [Bacillus thuringiensis]PFJ29048.1 hypothetical protein COJ15_32815 [Bacillus thuringiensis]
MKQKAKESFIKSLTKACTDENINIDLHLLSDKELKDLYLKLQAVQTLPYGIGKGEDFVTTMQNGKLQFISFRDTYKFGVRRLTFKEFLLLCEFVDENPQMYKFLGNWKQH